MCQLRYDVRHFCQGLYCCGITALDCNPLSGANDINAESLSVLFGTSQWHKGGSNILFGG